MLIPLKDIELFKAKALLWAQQFDIIAALNSNGYEDDYGCFEFALAVDYKEILNTNSFTSIEEFENRYNTDWIFGGFSYDLKNNIEVLYSQNPDFIKFPEAFFFIPKHLIIINNGCLKIESENALEIIDEINSVNIPNYEAPAKIDIKARFSKEDYLNTINNIIHEISLGNIYETNFCMEFYAEKCIINPLQTYLKLNQQSPTPFSNYFKWFDKYIISASPERFLAKRGNKLISQPIKGTAKRGSTPKEDETIIKKLKSNPKELQENVMIVDLVRNDLTKSAEHGTVRVEKLYEAHTFKQVHHLISTVVCQQKRDVSSVQSIKNTFPMGSMTGAPKLKSMELMEHFEASRRGMYSGSVGYFAPNGDFDFNVIIRSILYNDADKYLSFQVGSAITYHAIPEQEYEECLLKVKAILEILN